MIKKIIIPILSILFIVFIVFPFAFKIIFLNNLYKDSEIYNSSLGPIEYRLTGDKGPIILVAHGTPGGHDQTIPSTESYRVLTPSRPGYLRTPLSVGKTPKEQAQVFNELLNGLNIEKVIIMGISGGGPTSIEFAASCPEKVMGLVALEAVSFSEELSDADASGLEVPDRQTLFSFLLLYLLGDEAIAEYLLPSKVNQARLLSDPKNIQSIKDLLWTIWPFSERKDGFYNDYLQFSNLSLSLTSINAPVLIIHGNEDINVDIEQAEYIKELLPDSELSIIEGADHYMLSTHRNEINKIINDFINKIES